MTIRIRITLVLVLVVAGFAVGIIFLLFPQHRAAVTFLSSIIGGMAAIYSAYYVGESLRVTNRLTKLKNSFEFTDQLTSMATLDIRTFIHERLDQGSIPPAEMHAKIVEDKSLHGAVKLLLNKSEDIAVAVQHQFVDEAALKTSLEFVLPYYFKFFHDFIDEERTKMGYEGAYCNLEGLVKAWQAGAMFGGRSSV